MTNLEALQANISDAHGVVLTENHFRKALVDVGLSDEDEYSNSTLINRATVLLYNHIISGANISEGSLSYNVNLDAVKKAKAELEAELGITTRKPTINKLQVW